MKMRMSMLLCWMLVMMVSTVAAQDTITPCERALEDAETAFTDTDYETALESTETAEILCANDVFLFRDAINLRSRIEATQDYQAETDEIDAASPGLVDIGDYSTQNVN